MISKPSHYVQNQSTVIGSKILAKSAFNFGDHYRIVVVFALSTRFEFYWTFKARSPRSARRNWKFLGFAPLSNAVSFAEFADKCHRLHGQPEIFHRVSHKRALKALYTKTEHESIFSDWHHVPGVQTFDYVRSKLENGRQGRRAMLFR